MFNALMCYYTYNKSKMTLKYILFSLANFMINSYMVNNKLISLVNSDFYHIFFVQSPLAVCLNKVKNSLISFDSLSLFAYPALINFSYNCKEIFERLL